MAGEYKANPSLRQRVSGNSTSGSSGASLVHIAGSVYFGSGLPKDGATMRKTFQIDDFVLEGLKLLAKDRGVPLETLVDEALRTFLKKHGRPTSLPEALTYSLRQYPLNDNGAPVRTSRK